MILVEDLDLAAGDGRLRVAPDVSSSYALFLGATPGEAAALAQALSGRGLGWRRWYGPGLHHHPYLAGAPRGDLAVTDSIAARVVGIPMSVDLPAGAIRAVVDAFPPR